MTLRTTVIVGFPGETERDFERLCRFVTEVQFDRLGIFTYSREPGTAAAALRARPRASTAARRLRELSELQMHVSAARNAARVGSRLWVLVDGPVPEEDRASSALAAGAGAVGRSEAEALDIDGTIFLDGQAPAGSFVWARITAADVHDLHARMEATLPAEAARCRSASMSFADSAGSGGA
jgi:ribosomal protein S12 methylthiotransferase